MSDKNSVDVKLMFTVTILLLLFMWLVNTISTTYICTFLVCIAVDIFLHNIVLW